MRLKPGISIEVAEGSLCQAVNALEQARIVDSKSPRDPWEVYMEAVRVANHMVWQAFVEPDLTVSLKSDTYWNLFGTKASLSGRRTNGTLASELHHLIYREIHVQLDALKEAERQLESLKRLAERPGVPVVYDTNMLLHWAQPGDVKWINILKVDNQEASRVRLVVPLIVIDELDRHKYGQGLLAKRAATAIRYLENLLAGASPAEAVDLRRGVTLEVWLDPSNHKRSRDADVEILRCATEVDQLDPNAGTRVLTDDIGMRLRARRMDLGLLRLPEEYRKKGTSMDEVPARQ